MDLLNKNNLTQYLTDRMFEKIVENFIPLNPSRQYNHANSVNGRNRQYPREEMSDLLIRKVKSVESEPRLVVSIWQTESTFEMFDYENKGIKTKEYRIDGENDIYMANIDRRNTKCIVTKASVPNDNTYCGTIERSKGNYFFKPGTKIDTYRVVGSQSKQQYTIKAGDTIRIGRMRYFVKQTYNKFETSVKNFDRSEKAKQLNIQSLKSGTCKFCLCDEKDNPDILISPCNCKGSCAQVHLQCLKQWLSNKVSRKSTSCVQFLNYDNFNCELCKEDLPTTMRIDGVLYNILQETNTTNDPYIVLQGISNQKSSTTNNLTIKLKFSSKDSLILGRGHEADVRLQDVSISRQHCSIKFTCGRFQLSDNNSKFGTLMKVPAHQKINLGENKVQIARMTLQMLKPDTNKNGHLNLIKNQERY